MAAASFSWQTMSADTHCRCFGDCVLCEGHWQIRAYTPLGIAGMLAAVLDTLAEMFAE